MWLIYASLLRISMICMRSCQASPRSPGNTSAEPAFWPTRRRGSSSKNWRIRAWNSRFRPGTALISTRPIRRAPTWRMFWAASFGRVAGTSRCRRCATSRWAMRRQEKSAQNDSPFEKNRPQDRRETAAWAKLGEPSDLAWSRSGMTFRGPISGMGEDVAARVWWEWRQDRADVPACGLNAAIPVFRDGVEAVAWARRAISWDHLAWLPSCWRSGRRHWQPQGSHLTDRRAGCGESIAAQGDVGLGQGLIDVDHTRRHTLSYWK